MALTLRTLAAAFVAALLVPTTGAQGLDSSLRVNHPGGVHVLKAAPGGGLSCDVATEAELARSLEVEQAPVRLTVIPSLNDQARRPVSNFRILLRATDQLVAQPEALLAFRRAAARWERVITSSLTVVIDVDYGPKRFGTGEYDPGVIASASSALQFFDGSSSSGPVVARLRGRNTGDAQLQALYSAIPVPTPSTAGPALGRAIGGLIPLQALGARPAATDPSPSASPFGTVPNIGFNSDFDYDFDPSDGVGETLTDFETVVAHEIGHALAFTSAVGFAPSPPLFTPWDLFRVRPDDVTPGESLTDGQGWETAPRVVTPGPANTEVLAVENGTTYFVPVQVTFDGQAEYETSTATGTRESGDGQQASHWRDDALRPPSLGEARTIGIMDPTIRAGEQTAISFADIRLLQLTGFEVNFNPPTATIALSVGGQSIGESLVVAERSLGDLATGETRDIPVSVQNGDAANTLEFEAAVVVDAVYPSGVSPTVRLLSPSGSVSPSGSATATLRVGGVSQPAFVSGRLQVRSNDAGRAFIEVPFTFSVGGATEPVLTVASSADDGDDLGDFGPSETRTISATLSNSGSLPLDYRVFTSLARRQFSFSSQPEARRGQAPLFQATFESPADLSQFTFEGEGAPDRWQVTSAGRAQLPGHSSPNTAYFGSVGTTLTYSDNSFGQLVTPSFDLSGLDTGDLVELSFNYYLAAEAGFDFASVLVSVDGGDSYTVIATSDGGILQNTGPTDASWEAVTIEVPGVAGLQRPVQFAFRFESDGSVTDEGWYLDDIAVDVLAGQSPFFATPVDGVLGGGGSESLEVTVNTALLEAGFYRGAIQFETNQRAGDPDPIVISFSVGDPEFPTLASVAPAPSYSIPSDIQATVSLDVRNPGAALLTFVRVLDPAARDYRGGAARVASGVRPEGLTDARPSADVASGGPSAAQANAQLLADLVLPNSDLPGDLTQLPDGRLLVVDIGLSDGRRGQVFVVTPELSGVQLIAPPAEITTQVAAIEYDPVRRTVWMGSFDGEVQEFTLGGSATAPTLTATGTSVDLGFPPVGLTYSPELDAFFTTPFQSDVLLAFDRTGDVLPGYPVLVDDRDNAIPGLSITDGVVEIGGANLSVLQVGQFGRPFSEAQTTTVASSSVGGSARINGYLRSVVDPDGVAYYVTNPNADGVSRIYSVDPPDLPASFETRIRAGEPLYANQSVEPGQTFALSIVLDSEGLDAGSYVENLMFLTNSPSQRLVEIPVEISVRPVSAEPDATAAFRLREVLPNPARSSAQVRLELASAAAVTVEVYSMLGQRVAVLASDAPMAAGLSELTLETGRLAAGVYVVRVRAGGEVATQKLTVIR